MKLLYFILIFILFATNSVIYSLFVVSFFHGESLNGLTFEELATSSKVFLLGMSTLVPYYFTKAAMAHIEGKLK